jgi:hypothetical protein
VRTSPPPSARKLVRNYSARRRQLMSAMAVSSIAFGCVFGGALLGMFLRGVLPEHHLNADSKDVVKLGMGLIATMSALVLALLIASAKGSYDTQRSEVTQMSADIVQLDRVLVHYGPQAKSARDLERDVVIAGIASIWSERTFRTGELNSRTMKDKGARFFDEIQQLSPQNDYQRSLMGQALQISADLGHIRSLLLEQTGGSIPMPFLVVLVFWLSMIFASFGLFAPVNPTVIAILLVCAISVAGAIFLVLELDQPFAGLIRISDEPMRRALTILGQPK